MELVNWRLLAHPINWGIVWIILLLVMMAYTFVHDGVKQNAADRSIIPE